MAITKETLLRAPKLKMEEVDVGNIGLVRFSELNCADRLAFSEEFAKTKGEERSITDSMRSSLRFVAQALRDDEWGPMFPTDELDDAVEALLRWPLDDVRALIEACNKVNGLGEEELKEEVGNSDGDPS